jgi:hypothetical protein
VFRADGDYQQRQAARSNTKKAQAGVKRKQTLKKPPDRTVGKPAHLLCQMSLVASSDAPVGERLKSPRVG